MTDQRLKTILWPDALPAPGTFNTQVSMARSKLGLDVHGQLRLPHISSNDGRYGVSHAVMTDLGRLETCVEQAKSCNTFDAVEPLRDALPLREANHSRSEPATSWAHTEGLVTHAEVVVADAAHRLARVCLEVGDPDGAQWAGVQGLKAAPVDEVLYRDRMLAHDLGGNSAGVESVMRELCEVVEGLEPYDSLHPETLELYARLTRRSKVARPRAV